MARILISGWKSYEDWKSAGYPGARSFPPERKPDLRAGLCTWPECNNVVDGRGSKGKKLCRKHYRPGIPQRPYVPIGERVV